MEPIRVLQEDVVLDRGGIEALLMNVYRNIDREQVQFDFMVHRPHQGDYEQEVTDLGGKIYHTPGFNPVPPKYNSYKNAMIKVFTEHPEYKVLHAHTELNGWPLKFAAKCGIPTRIAHAHNAKSNLNLKYFFFRYEKLWLKKYCTDMFMCSTPAGNWFYGEETVKKGNVKFIKNGIDTSVYKFSEQTRAQVRRELNAGEKIVFCHVGRFMQQKNHRFLIDIFNEIHKKNPNTLLVMAGDGPDREACEEKARNYNIYYSTRFLGVRKDVNRILQGADLFLFPSLWEGLPLTAVEAQSAGLPIVMTDVITSEAIITKGVRTCSLSDSPEKWADTALNLAQSYKRYDTQKEIIYAGFDIKETAKFLQDFYIDRTLRAREYEKNN